MKFRLGTLSKM